MTASAALSRRRAVVLALAAPLALGTPLARAEPAGGGLPRGARMRGHDLARRRERYTEEATLDEEARRALDRAEAEFIREMAAAERELERDLADGGRAEAYRAYEEKIATIERRARARVEAIDAAYAERVWRR
ncbi:MAG: hypothetical protein ACFBWO_15890 [Paracoccaceae bacterium]